MIYQNINIRTNFLSLLVWHCSILVLFCVLHDTLVWSLNVGRNSIKSNSREPAWFDARVMLLLDFDGLEYSSHLETQPEPNPIPNPSSYQELQMRRVQMERHTPTPDKSKKRGVTFNRLHWRSCSAKLQMQHYHRALGCDNRMHPRQRRTAHECSHSEEVEKDHHRLWRKELRIPSFTFILLSLKGRSKVMRLSRLPSLPHRSQRDYKKHASRKATVQEASGCGSVKRTMRKSCWPASGGPRAIE